MKQSSESAPCELVVKWSASVDDYVTALDVSADGDLIAIGTSAGELRILEAKSGMLHSRQTVHSGGVLAAKWSPRQRTLVTSGQDGFVRLLNAAGEALSVQPVAPWAEQLAWAPDGRKFAATSGEVVRLFGDVGETILHSEPHAGGVTGVAWSHRGDVLATACQEGIRLFRADSAASSRRLPWRVPLVSVCFSPDDEVVASVTAQNAVHFWRLRVGRDAEIAGFPARPRGLAWDGGSRLLATSGDPKVAVWTFDGNGPEGQRPILLPGHEALCTVVAFHPEQPWLASGSDDTRVILWQPGERATPCATGILDDTVTGVAWALSGSSLLAVDARGTVRAWSLE